MSFTSHSILFPDGTRSIPQQEGLLADGSYIKSVLALSQTLLPADSSPTPRVADLGCLEGGYAVEFARAGYEVLGVEARATNIAKCEIVRQKMGLPNLRFVQDDVRKLAQHGSFDIVFCAGLLYHLDEPVSFLRTLGELTNKLLFVQTHYAIVDDSYAEHPLSPLCEHEGKLGRWFMEHPAGSTAAQHEHNVWASYGNAKSFWLEKKHLLQAIKDAGFDLVSESHDWIGDIVGSDYIDKYCRNLFIGIKSRS